MQSLNRKITVTPDLEVSSVWCVPDTYEAGKRLGLILAHGAGNDMNSSFISHLHEALAQKGMMTVKFNFPYTERGRKAPDRTPVLEATWRSVATSVRNDTDLAPNQVFFAGKSLGGRIASHLATEGEACAGLVFFGYPLHPPNRKETLRANHLQSIRCPMLFIQGTRDALCDLELLDSTLKQLDAASTLHRIEAGDHSFKVLKRLGRSEQSVWEEIVDVTVRWLQSSSKAT